MLHWSSLYLVSEWTIRFVMLVYVPQQRSAAASRTWLLLIFLLPWPGVALYALFGRIRVPRERIVVAGCPRGKGGNWQNGPLPTISCINIRPLPQPLGRGRAIWYLRKDPFDRH